MNNLKNSLSPYLLEHKDNPIDWNEWNEEIIEVAKKENKPIFLSIGYSTCHWCYVMKKECFEDGEIAKILNENYISIKVDREERPDIDQIYMSFLFLLKGYGGWPLNVFLTPHLKPFYGGSYFKREEFKYLILKLAELWKEKGLEIEKDSERIFTEMKRYFEKKDKKNEISKEKILDEAFLSFKNSFDYIYGGFNKAPKFPMAPALKFLLNYYINKKEEEALNMVLYTLKKISTGGIYDQIAGGLHRYSVDERWQIPHFEKMLYDQLGLLELFLEVYKINKEKSFKTISENLLKFILKEMKSEEGGLVSAIDADSLNEKNEMGEGLFYRWKEKEIFEILGKEKSEVFFENFGLVEGVVYKKNGKELEEILKILYEQREKRKKPKKDDKEIAFLQGFAISSFSKASLILKDKKYLKEAKDLENFVLKNLYNYKNKNLFRYFRDKKAIGDGFLEDYSFLIKGLIDLYEISGEFKYLNKALDFQEKQIELFYDENLKSFYNTNKRDILFKTTDDYESSIPSGTSISLLNLLKISKLTENTKYLNIAKEAIENLSENIGNNPTLMPNFLTSLMFFENPIEFIIACNKEDYFEFICEIFENFSKEKVIIFADGEEGQTSLSKYHPFLKNIKMIDFKPTLYICKDYHCEKPLNNLSQIKEKLKNL